MAQQPNSDLDRFVDYIQISDTPRSVRPLRMSDRPFAETSSGPHAIFTTDRYPRPWRDSNLQSQQASCSRPTPQTARPLESAGTRLSGPKHYGQNTIPIPLLGGFISLFELWFVSARVVLVSCGKQLEYTPNSNRRFDNCYSNTGCNLHKIKESNALV